MRLKFTNSSRFVIVSNSQTFRSKGRGSSISKPSIDGLSDPLGTVIGARHTFHMSKEINPNATRKCGMVPMKNKNSDKIMHARKKYFLQGKGLNTINYA